MIDEFIKVRIKLIVLYTTTVTILITGYSLLLYEILMSDFTNSIHDRLFGLNPKVAQMIVERTSDILQGRIIFADLLIICIVVFLSFILINKTLRPIRENLQKQKRFVADASHEMRTPIAVMISGLEVALRDKNLTVEKARDTLQDTLTEMKEFSYLSTHLLDISRYDAGVHTPHVAVRVKEVLDSVVQKMSVLAKEKNINLITDTEVDVHVFGDTFEIARVFSNIIQNAIKYTNTDGSITIETLCVGTKKNKKYICTITDTGIGMSEDVIQKIFDPFFQHDVSRSGGGAGLGLTLSKRIVENHKGNIHIESVLGKGTTVKLTFPVSSH